MTQLVQRLTREQVKRTPEELVCSIPEPDFTATWSPHSHKTIIQSVKIAVTKLGLKITKKLYSLTADGGNMFGLWSVDGNRNGKIACIGFRNSIVKQMSVGFCAFFTMIFCTNQISKGKFINLRKHTARLSVEEIGSLASVAIENVMKQFAELDAWMNSLKDISLSDQIAEQMIIDAMRKEVLAPRRFKEFDKLLFGNGEEPVYDKTLFGFHGALTQMIREHSFHSNVEENKQITAFINESHSQLSA